MWTLDTAAWSAVLETPQLAVRIDLCRPDRGVRPTRLGAHVLTDDKSLLGIDLGAIDRDRAPTPPEDAFVRGTDLIVRYPTTARQTQMQIDWRALLPTATAPEFGVEVIVGVRTELLASDPRFAATSEFPATQFAVFADEAGAPRTWRPADGGPPDEGFAKPLAVAATWTESEFRYVELPYAGDIQETRLHAAPAAGASASRPIRIVHTLLDPFLEKGVMRRCRLRAIWLPAGATDADVRAAAARFVDSPLPLTA